jgi:hypothetical protein
MVGLRNLCVFAIVLLFAATPAMASGSSAVPEPNNLVLLGMGVAGLVMGRRAAKRRPKD